MTWSFGVLRPAEERELAELVRSAPEWPDFIREAEIGEIPTVKALGSLRTVLQRGDDQRSRHMDPWLSVAEAAELFARPEHSNLRDIGPYRHFLEVAAADRDFQPELIIAPMPNQIEWWLVEGIHRAAALFTVRRAEGWEDVHLRVFVLPRPIT